MKVYFSPLVESYTRQSILDASKGYYMVDSMEVEWGVLNSSLTIRNFTLRSDSSLFLAQQAADTGLLPMINLFIPRIDIERFNMLELYQESLLKVAELRVQKPVMLIQQGKNSTTTDSTSGEKFWKKLLPQNLQTLRLDRVSIEEGTLEFQHLDSLESSILGINNLNINLKSVQLDSSTVNSISPLAIVEDISISGKMSDYPFIFKEENHKINIGSFEGRVSSRSFQFNDFQIEPLLSGRLIDSSNYKGISASIPQIKIHDLDLEKIFRERDFRFNTLQLEKPNIRHILPANSFVRDTVRQIFRLPFFNGFGFDRLTIQKGNYFAHKTAKDLLPLIGLKGIQVRLEKLNIDNGDLYLDDLLTYLNTLTIKIDTIEVNLEASNYSVTGEDFVFHTDSGNINLGHLYINNSRSNFKTHFSAEIPELFISGIQLQKLLKEQKLLAQSLKIHRPLIDIYQKWGEPDSQLIIKWTKFDGYHLIQNILGELNIGQIGITDGLISVYLPQNKAPFMAKDIHLDIQQFIISPYTHHWMQAPFYASDFDLDFNIDGYSFILPDSSYSLQASRLSFSARDSTLEVDSLLVLPLYSDSSALSTSTKVFVGIPRIRLKGLDFYHAYFQHEVNVDSLWVLDPGLQLRNMGKKSSTFDISYLDSLELYPFISPLMNKLSIGFLTFEDAIISRQIVDSTSTRNTHLPQISLTLDHLEVDSTSKLIGKRFLYADNFKVHLNNIYQPLPDSLHHLAIKNISYTSADKHIAIDSIQLTPLVYDSTIKTNVYNITTPHIRINGLDPLELYTNKQLALNDVQIIQPLIHLLNHPEEVKKDIDSLAQANLYDFISEYLHNLEIQNLVVTEGELYLRNWGDKPENAFHADDLLVIMKGFRLDSTSWANPYNPFYAQDIDIDMDANNYSFVLPDSTYILQIGSIGMSTEDSILSAFDISLIPLEDQLRFNDANLMWQIEVPRFQVKGFEPAQWYFHQIANLKHVHITQPKVRLEHLKPTGTREHDPMEVYNFISRHFQELYIKDLLVDKASLDEIRHPVDTVKPLSIKDLSIRAKNISPDTSDFLAPEHLFYSNDVRIRIEKYGLNLPEQEYELYFDELGMHTASNQLYARGLKISPQLNHQEFFNKYGYVRDHITFHIPDVKAEHVDLDAFIHHQRFRADRLLLQGLAIDVLKDKSYPEKPDKRPPMVQDIIRDLPFYLRLDTISVANGSIDFKQYVPDLKKDAYFNLGELYADVYNLTNDSLLLSQKVTVGLHANARIMQTGRVVLNFSIPLSDTSNMYSFEGKLSRMNFMEFNPILEQTAFVSATSGTIHQGTFNINTIQRQRKRRLEYIYKGKMKLRYSNLKLSVIDKKSMFQREDAYDERKMVTIIANTLVNTNNPKGRGRFLRVGKIFYKREPNKGMIGHWVQALVSGMRSSVGLENKDNRERLIIPGLRKKNKKDKVQAPSSSSE